MAVGISWPIMIRRGLIQLRQRFVSQTAAVLAMAVALGLAALAVGLFLELDQSSRRLGDQFRLIVYLDPISKTDQEALIDQVSELDGVQGVISVSPRESLRRLEALLGDQKSLLNDLEPGMVPPLLEIHLTPRARRPAALARLQDQLQALNGVDEAVYSRGWAERLSQGLNLIKQAGLIIAGGLTGAGLFLVFAAIRTALTASRQELEVLQFLGAPGWYIKGPYLVQGAGQGLIAAVLAAAGLAGLNRLIAFSLADSMFSLDLTGWAMTGAIIVAGVLSGLIGSYLALLDLAENR